MSKELSYIIQKICDQFGQSPDCLRATPVSHGSSQRNNVWLLRTKEDLYVLKSHLIPHTLGVAGFAPTQTEAFVLTTLYDAGCNVPRIIWQSDSDSYLLLEWVGESTLDDIAQTDSSDTVTKATINALTAFCQVEEAFVNHAGTIQPHVYRLDYPTFLAQAMDTMINRGRTTLSYLSHLNGTRGSTARKAEFDAFWKKLSERLRLNTPTLGALDYNARNVLLRGEAPSFVDFACIGWDWSERRIIQLFNSLGSNRNSGNFINLLNRDIVKTYTKQAVRYRAGCSERDIAAQIDYHNILFYLATVHRLLEAVVHPKTKTHKQLLSAWRNPDARLKRALYLLEHSCLSDDACAAEFRRFIGEFRKKS